MEYSIGLNKLFIENGIISKIYLYIDNKYNFYIRQKCDDDIFLGAIKIFIKEMIKENKNSVVELCSHLRYEDDLNIIRDICKNLEFPKLEKLSKKTTGVYPIKNDGFNFVILQDSKIKIISTVRENEIKYIGRDNKDFLTNFKLALIQIIDYNYDGFLKILECINDDKDAFSIAYNLYIEQNNKIKKLKTK